MSIKSDKLIKRAEAATRAMKIARVAGKHVIAINNLISSHKATREALSRQWQDNRDLRNYITNEGIDDGNSGN